jgi:hypothetical protein
LWRQKFSNFSHPHQPLPSAETISVGTREKICPTAKIFFWQEFAAQAFHKILLGMQRNSGSDFSKISFLHLLKNGMYRKTISASLDNIFRHVYICVWCPGTALE